MYAIFENGSKQYKACVGETVKLEKLTAEVGETVTFPAVLTADDKGNVKCGKEVEKVLVAAEVLNVGKDKKIIVFKYKAKKNERKKQGHRQPYTTVKVTAIGEGLTPKKAEPKKVEAKKAEPKKVEAKPEVKAEVKAEVKEPAAKPAAKSTAPKAAAPKSAAAKPAAKATEAKPAAKKTTEAKSTAAKTTTTKTTAAKSTTAKTTAAKSTTAKKPANKD